MAERARSAAKDCRLRADAERNRARIVAAARTVFAEQGLETPTSEVARRAGVGIATLFRRFPTREDLLAATFAEKMCRYADAIDEAADNPDPWEGFCTYVTQVCAMQSADRGFTDLLTQAFPTAKSLEADRDRAFHRFTELVDRAKQSGRLRQDFVPEDLPMLLMANAGVVTATADAAPQTSDRLVAYLLQAFAADAAAPLPDPPTPRQMYKALLRATRPTTTRTKFSP
jgi:AcrR family transcriptional regulator